MMHKVMLGLVALGLCAACEKKEEAPATTPSSEAALTATAAPTPVAAAAATAPTIDLETLPTEEEFEEEAEKEITSASLDKKLDELEKEISAE